MSNKLNVVPFEQMVYYDVDETLVSNSFTTEYIYNSVNGAIPGYVYYGNSISIVNPYTDETVQRVPIACHIDLLKQHKARGFGICVWSLGGVKWAEAVVKALGIESYVDVVISKPLVYVDDLKCEQFMPHNLYLYNNPERK